MSLFQHNGIGLNSEISFTVLFFIILAIFFLFLVAATFWIQNGKSSKYLAHLNTSAFVSFYSLIFFVPIAAFLSILFSNYGGNPISKVTEALPRILVSTLFYLAMFIPMMFLTSLVSKLLVSKVENKNDISDHLIQ